MKKIKITIRKDGTLQIEVLGVAGDACVALTRELEQRLGVQVGERTFKPEYNQAERETERETEREVDR